MQTLDFGITVRESASLASTAEGITTGPDGNIWFTEAYDGKISRLQL